MINKPSALILLAATLLVPGCSLFGGKPGLYVAKKIKPGMAKEEVLKVLSEGATHLEERALHLAGSDSWNSLLELKPIHESMKDAEEETGKTTHSCSEVARMWGFMGFDIYYLYLSEEDILIGYTQHHVN